MEEVIKTSKTVKGQVYLYKSGIMHQTYDKGAEIRMEDSDEEIKIYKAEYCGNLRRPMLVELNNVKTVSKESRAVYSSEETAMIFSAAALLVGNPVSRILGNFYMGINKTTMPVKMFTKKDEAITWLKTFVTE